MFIAAILKPEGPTHRTVRNLLTITEVYAPEILLEETTKHLTELATKKNTPVKELHTRIKLLKQAIKFIPTSQYKQYLDTAAKLVRDPADRWFAALALSLSKKYKMVVILTYNKKKDYKNEELLERGIIVLTPRELQDQI